MLNRLGIFGIYFALIFQASYPPAFPRENTKKVLENDRFIVWDTVWLKGQPTVMHVHDHNAVSITVQEGSTTATTPDGVTSSPTVNKVGDFLYREKGVVHSEMGTTDTPRRAIVVELKDINVAPSTTKIHFPDAYPRDGAKKSVDNDRVVIWDYTFQPGKSSPMQVYSKDTVAVFLGSGKIKSTASSGSEKLQEINPGTVLYYPREHVESEEAVQGMPRAIVVELK